MTTEKKERPFNRQQKINTKIKIKIYENKTQR